MSGKILLLWKLLLPDLLLPLKVAIETLHSSHIWTQLIYFVINSLYLEVVFQTIIH